MMKSLTGKIAPEEGAVRLSHAPIKRHRGGSRLATSASPGIASSIEAGRPERMPEFRNIEGNSPRRVASIDQIANDRQLLQLGGRIAPLASIRARAQRTKQTS